MDERNSRLKDQPLRLLSCELDAAWHRLLRGGSEVRVTPKAFGPVMLLAAAAPLDDGEQVAFGDLAALYRESKPGQSTATRVGSALPRL